LVQKILQGRAIRYVGNQFERFPAGRLHHGNGLLHLFCTAGSRDDIRAGFCQAERQGFANAGGASNDYGYFAAYIQTFDCHLCFFSRGRMLPLNLYSMSADR
jgi:hypothetical protein